MIHALSLAFASLKSRALYSVLSVISVGAGIALLSALFLLTSAIAEGIQRNARAIDVVVGAKGSKLQLVLSSIYHTDIPAGNIDAGILEKIKANPQVSAVIPLVIGDSYRGMRIVGTTPDYIGHYKAELSSGRAFENAFEVVAGEGTGLKPGETFAATHGLSVDGGDVHGERLFKVVGILRASGTVLDRLLLTTVSSVHMLHTGHAHDHEEHPADEDAHNHEKPQSEEASHQLTALLVQTRSPIAAVNLPRQINQSMDVMAASPAYEMARLSRSFGIGKDVLTGAGAAILFLAGLMLFSTLGAGLASRRYDLAVMRALGAPRLILFATVIFEGMIIGFLGALAGMLAGHAAAVLLVTQISGLQGIVPIEPLLKFGVVDGVLVLTGTVAGLLAALPPALSAFKLDIAGLLARGT